jgi:hypothetical protein
MELPRDPAHVRGGEALATAVHPDDVAAGGAVIRSAGAAGGSPEGAQERALLANCVDRSLHIHDLAEAEEG